VTHKEEAMATAVPVVTVHDVIEVTARRVGDPSRTGEIVEVLGSPDRPHYRVHWDDGHESVFYPGEGVRVRHGSAHRRHELPESCHAVVDALVDADVAFELLPHRQTMSASTSARELGIEPRQVAKTVVVRAGGRLVRTLVAASRRVDLRKLEPLLDGVPALLTEEELDGAYPQFELGSVPPFGGPAGDEVVVDFAVAALPDVVVETGSHALSLRLGTRDLLAVAGARVADIVED
jgi:prolyl-tRNA editing enzyme YbaK/EbsC (Cys-tRNA(Pro) deacylase)